MSRRRVAYRGARGAPGGLLVIAALGRPADAQEAMGLRRRAHERCVLQPFYEELGMLTGARHARRDMMKLLGVARSVWRRALGLAP